ESIGDVIEGRVSLLSEDGLLVGIHGDNAVAVGHHIGGHAVTWPRGLGRKADHGEGLTFFEDIEDGIGHTEAQIAEAPWVRDRRRRRVSGHGYNLAALRKEAATRCKASRNCWFSSCLPTVTRREVGKP